MDDHALHVDDDGFVRAPVADVYPVLTHVAAWPDWWPGTAVAPRATEDRYRVALGDWPRRVRLDVEAHAWRHDAGFRLHVRGSSLHGEVEFWFEEGWGGTVVHHLANLRSSRRAPLQHYRRWARSGLWGVKDHVQGAVGAVVA